MSSSPQERRDGNAAARCCSDYQLENKALKQELQSMQLKLTKQEQEIEDLKAALVDKSCSETKKTVAPPSLLAHEEDSFDISPTSVTQAIVPSTSKTCPLKPSPARHSPGKDKITTTAAAATRCSSKQKKKKNNGTSDYSDADTQHVTATEEEDGRSCPPLMSFGSFSHDESSSTCLDRIDEVEEREDCGSSDSKKRGPRDAVLLTPNTGGDRKVLPMQMALPLPAKEIDTAPDEPTARRRLSSITLPACLSAGLPLCNGGRGNTQIGTSLLTGCIVAPASPPWDVAVFKNNQATSSTALDQRTAPNLHHHQVRPLAISGAVEQQPQEAHPERCGGVQNLDLSLLKNTFSHKTRRSTPFKSNRAVTKNWISDGGLSPTTNGNGSKSSSATVPAPPKKRHVVQKELVVAPRDALQESTVSVGAFGATTVPLDDTLAKKKPPPSSIQQQELEETTTLPHTVPPVLLPCRTTPQNGVPMKKDNGGHYDRNGTMATSRSARTSTTPGDKETLRAPRREGTLLPRRQRLFHNNETAATATKTAAIISTGKPVNQLICSSTAVADDSKVSTMSSKNDSIFPPSSSKPVASVHAEGKQVTDAKGEGGLYTGSIDQNTRLPHGNGEMIYAHAVDDGRTYCGQWQQGQWHGQGCLTDSAGDIYEGSFAKDVKNGRGILTNASQGRVYDGFFRDDKMYEGKITFTGGGDDNHGQSCSYEGMLDLHGKRSGHGLYIFEDGSFYEGQWSDDHMNGRGKMVWSNGSSYNGEWFFGIRHGIGTETLECGTVAHQGHWINGESIPNAEAILDPSQIDSVVYDTEIATTDSLGMMM